MLVCCNLSVLPRHADVNRFLLLLIQGMFLQRADSFGAATPCVIEDRALIWLAASTT